MIVLSLDHGNVSGHSVLEILSEIMHRLNYDIEKSGLYPEWRRRNGRQCVRACDVFDVIAGSGTGGLVAGLLSALKMDDKDASNAYNDIAGFLFPSNTVQTEGPSTSMEIPNASNQSATKGLEAVLRAVVQANTESQQENYPLVSTDINGTGNGLILARSKVNAPIETQALFRTYQAPPSLVNANCALWQALRATTADLANGTLSTCTIGGREYWAVSRLSD
ncbi:hypothetical protein DL96DRAFT_912171 [Flagelloscypha sp. PMI_526]|nr:hypothetical protein DL96DRAFT_912171 [Flagelloscypha sp. PMI_526]